MNTMAKYRVTVRRIVREDIEIIVEAPDAQTAAQEAELQATCEPQEKWETYDCDYTGHDVEPIK